MRYLGVDPGGRRMGFAVGDRRTGVATPLEVVPYDGVAEAARRIADAARRHRADTVVVGWPCDADGGATAACRRSELLAEAVRGHGLAVVLQPEFLTTDEARRRGRDAGLGAAAAVDHLAAQVLLEEYLAATARAGD